MLKMIALLVPALVTPPQALNADTCPRAEDVAGDGVWIQYDDWITHYRRTAPNTIVEISYYEDGSAPYFIESHFGLYITQDADMKNGAPDPTSHRNHVYPEGIVALPEPEPGVEWKGSMQIRDVGKPDDPALELHTYWMTGDEPLQIGDCAYTSVRVDAVYNYLDGDGDADEIRYLPDLNISVLTATGKMNKPYDTQYTIRAISRTRP